MGISKALLVFLRAMLAPRVQLALENLALRQQLAICRQSVKRPKLRHRDRIFWVLLSRFWTNWRTALAIVRPETVIKWHRMGFKLYWRWKSRAGKPGRPPIDREVRDLIRRMSRENPTWGAPRILSELALLGHNVAEGTVAKYFDFYHNARPHLSLDRNSPTPRKVEPPSQGHVIAIGQVGGLHHRYSRAA